MISAAALLLAAAISSPAASSAGEWAGTMARGGDRLTVQFDLPNSDHATLSAPDIGAIGIPLRQVQLGSTVHWELVGDDSTTRFDGKLSGDLIEGTFTEPGKSIGTFSLHRVLASAAPYDKRDVTFFNGDVRLAGTLFLPRGAALHPGIVFVHGSGDEGRWASGFLADYVARHGVAALVYDKRGVGGSSGSWRTSTLLDLAGDARAGVALLARTPGLDPHGIGIYGHSQGGAIAPQIAAANPQVRFIIAADGPVGPQYEQDIFRVDGDLRARYSGQQLADAERLYREFVDVARSGQGHKTLRADMQAAGAAPWLGDLGIPGDDSWVWDWYPRYANYDNRAAWANVRVPVLVLFGGQDKIVPVRQSIAETVAILHRAGNDRVKVLVFDDADHTLHVPPRSAEGWPHLPPGFLQAITDFVWHASAGEPPARGNRAGGGGNERCGKPERSSVRRR